MWHDLSAGAAIEGLARAKPNQGPSPRDMALLDRVSRSSDEEARLYVAALKVSRLPPLTCGEHNRVPSASQKMWWKWLGASPSLVLPIWERFDGTSRTVLRRSLRALLDQYEVLRSFYFEHGDELRVGLNPTEDFEIEFAQIKKGEWAALPDLANEFLQRPMSATDKWHVRAKIVSFSNTSHAVLILFNHLIVDGVSVGIIRKQLRGLVERSLPAEWLGAAPGFFQYVDWQNKWLNIYARPFENYWRHWAHHKAPSLGSAGTELTWKPGAKRAHQFKIPHQMYDVLRALAKKARISAFIAFLTVYVLAVARWSGSRRLSVRNIADGRVLPDFKSVIGLTIASDAIDIVLVGTTFCEAAKQIELEYFSAAKLHNPSLYSFPPYVIGFDADVNCQSTNVPIVINYRAISAPPPVPKEDNIWPPPITKEERKSVAYPVSAICMELTCFDSFAICSLLLHKDQLSDDQQDALVCAVIEVLSELQNP